MAAKTFQFRMHSGECFTKCTITQNNQSSCIWAKLVETQFNDEKLLHVHFSIFKVEKTGENFENFLEVSFFKVQKIICIIDLLCLFCSHLKYILIVQSVSFTTISQ